MMQDKNMTHWHVAALNWLDELPADALVTLRSNASVLMFKNGEHIFAPK